MKKESEFSENLQRNHDTIMEMLDQKTTMDSILEELDEDPSKSRRTWSAIYEIISNLDRMLPRYPSIEEIKIAVREAVAGERESITSIKLDTDKKEQIINIIMDKIKKL